MRFPEPQNPQIPAGHYQFRLNREPELRKVPYVKDGVSKEATKIVVYAVGLGDNGQFNIADSIFTGDKRYADLLKALGVQHSADVDPVGSVFEADVVYEQAKNDPTKSYPRLVNISARHDVPMGDNAGGDDIPF